MVERTLFRPKDSANFDRSPWAGELNFELNFDYTYDGVMRSKSRRDISRYACPKGDKTTNWAARHLIPQQIVYAATDAWVCSELYLQFKDLKLV